MPDIPSNEPQPGSLQAVPSGAKGAGELQRTLPGDGQLPTGMEMEGGIAATALGRGRTALGWAGTVS